MVGGWDCIVYKSSIIMGETCNMTTGLSSGHCSQNTGVRRGVTQRGSRSMTQYPGFHTQREFNLNS